MKILDPGHRYLVDSYDGVRRQIIDFMKREGKGYPGNRGTRAGTNIQEIIRVIIDREKYLNNQVAHRNNLAIIRKQRECLWLLEDRAAERHNIDQFDFRPDSEIELVPHCLTCGHLVCRCPR